MGLEMKSESMCVFINTHTVSWSVTSQTHHTLQTLQNKGNINMKKFRVMLGDLVESVVVEHLTHELALKNVLATQQTYAICQIPLPDKKPTHWVVRNVNDPKDEMVVSSPEKARNILTSTRKDVTELFWFVDVSSNSKTIKKLKPSK